MAGPAIGWDAGADHFEPMPVVGEQHDLPIGEILLQYGQERPAIRVVEANQHIVQRGCLFSMAWNAIPQCAALSVNVLEGPKRSVLIRNSMG